jgi:hypothetical protein
MKTLKILFATVVILTLVNCGSKSNYTKNTLDKDFYQSKTIYFTLNQKSKTTMDVKGGMPVLGGYKPPNVAEVFIASIQELADETQIDLRFTETPEKIAKNEMLIDVEILEITWKFGMSVATLKTNVNYKLANQSELINTVGIRKSGGGSERNNLRKSLKNATYNFLLAFEKAN